ncbi:MAG: 2OG-Fe(II) oxygenase [Betaproteobacteria bacterium]|nr:MAG: 2OG-Fe(II) oxygenase [Betaproteobacteria bacterium]
MIQLRKSSVVVDPACVGRLKSEFAQSGYVLLPQLLDTDLLQFLLPRLSQPRWIRRVEKNIAAEDVLDDELALSLLHFVSNSPAFLGAIREVCDCSGASVFRGRIYRLLPDPVHHDSWHDDVGDAQDHRLVGMSINLGPRAYAGGLFQLRDFISKRMIREVANTGWGDATLFRISLQLEHQVSAVTGKEPRIAFAGWFRSDMDDFFTSLRRASARSE